MGNIIKDKIREKAIFNKAGTCLSPNIGNKINTPNRRKNTPIKAITTSSLMGKFNK